jgi:hypothetical protein
LYTNDFKVVDCEVQRSKKKRPTEAEATRLYMKRKAKKVEYQLYETPEQKSKRESNIDHDVFKIRYEKMEFMMNRIKPGWKPTSKMVLDDIEKRKLAEQNKRHEHIDHGGRNFKTPSMHTKTYFKGANELIIGTETSLKMTDFQMLKRLNLPNKNDLIENMPDAEDSKFDYSSYSGIPPREFARSVLENCGDIRPKDQNVLTLKKNLSIRRQRNLSMMQTLAPSYKIKGIAGFTSPCVKYMQPSLTPRDICKCQMNKSNALA